MTHEKQTEELSKNKILNLHVIHYNIKLLLRSKFLIIYFLFTYGIIIYAQIRNQSNIFYSSSLDELNFSSFIPYMNTFLFSIFLTLPLIVFGSYFLYKERKIYTGNLFCIYLCLWWSCHITSVINHVHACIYQFCTFQYITLFILSAHATCPHHYIYIGTLVFHGYLDKKPHTKYYYSFGIRVFHRILHYRLSIRPSWPVRDHASQYILWHHGTPEYNKLSSPTRLLAFPWLRINSIDRA